MACSFQGRKKQQLALTMPALATTAPITRRSDSIRMQRSAEPACWANLSWTASTEASRKKEEAQLTVSGKPKGFRQQKKKEMLQFSNTRGNSASARESLRKKAHNTPVQVAMERQNKKKTNAFSSFKFKSMNKLPLTRYVFLVFQ